MKKILLFLKTKLGIIILISTLVLGTSTCLLIKFSLDKNPENTKKCVIQFETNGGSKIKSQKIKCGSKVNKPNDPKKEGFEFENWYLNEEIFDFDKEINKSIKISAKFKEIEGIEYIEIIFDTNGGSKIDNIKIKKGEKLNSPNNPTKKGFLFDGWYLNEKKFDFDEKIDESITLIAKWKKEEKNSTSSNNNKNSNKGNEKSNNSNNKKENKTDNTNNKNNENKNTISLSTNSISLKTGESTTFSMTYSPSDANWLALGCNSNNENAILNTSYSSSGIYTVTGVHEGTSTITCYNSNGGEAHKVTKSITVNVTKTRVSSIAITCLNLEIGKNGQMRYDIYPSNAYDKSVTWSSSNPSVLSIDQNGNVYGASVGSSVVTVRSNDGGYTSSCTVNVREPATVQSVRITNCPMNLRYGESIKLNVNIIPLDTTTITWSSLYNNATVDQSGNVTIIGSGTAIIYATADANNSIRGYCSIGIPNG